MVERGEAQRWPFRASGRSQEMMGDARPSVRPWKRSAVSMHAMTRSVARHTVLDVDMEDSLERLHPVHGGDVVTGVTRCIGRIDPLMR